MDPIQIVNQAKSKFQSAIVHFLEDIKKLRTGRANANILDGIMVQVYGTSMQLIQVGNVTIPETQLIQITPFDPNNIPAIVKAISDNQSLGLNPMDDGRVIRIPVPPLNEERRRDFVKLLSGKVEDAMVVLRNIRHEALHDLDQAKKDKIIGEDDAKRYEKQVDEALNHSKTDVESAAKTKEQDIMKV